MSPGYNIVLQLQATMPNRRYSKNIKPEVWLAELTHTGQTIASETIPLAPGMLAAYSQKIMGSKLTFRLFKFPEKLIKNFLSNPPPKVVGFTNYIWNFNLSYAIAERIKKISPSTLILFGGPNYPLDGEDQILFFREYPMIDFYIRGEGEKALAELLEKLYLNDFQAAPIKKLLPANCHFEFEGKFCRGTMLERLDIREIPSPYLNGLLDEFFEYGMMPLIQTVRGCPFSCTYCCEGQPYYRKVSFRDPQQIKKELSYIATRSKNVNLNIADSNFGQYPQDLNSSQFIQDIQKKYGYPKYIHVATGKRNQKNVVELSRMVNGALRLSASIQSCNNKVLKNIKRKNVSFSTLAELVREANRTGSNTYSEIILGLPGDSKKAHLDSIEKMMNLGLNLIRCYSLMILKGSDLSLKETKNRFHFMTRYRVVPRCFGFYKFGKESIPLAEFEEVCVANKTLSFDDYLKCRAFDLSVEIFYNDKILSELLSFLKFKGVPAFALLLELNNQKKIFPRNLKKIYDDFLQETVNELWESRGDLQKFTGQRVILNKYIQGELGSNLIFKYKSLALIRYLQEIHDVAFKVAEKIFLEKKPIDKKITERFLTELKLFSLFQKKNLLQLNQSFFKEFNFDFKKGIDVDFQIEPEKLLLEKPQQATFKRGFEQEKIISNQLEQFGKSVVGISRILSRIYIKKMYRVPYFA
jgi:radical SAM superfamily enzyme YgiQ (UPF0313 family)